MKGWFISIIFIASYFNTSIAQTDCKSEFLEMVNELDSIASDKISRYSKMSMQTNYRNNKKSDMVVLENYKRGQLSVQKYTNSLIVTDEKDFFYIDNISKRIIKKGLDENQSKSLFYDIKKTYRMLADSSLSLRCETLDNNITKYICYLKPSSPFEKVEFYHNSKKNYIVKTVNCYRKGSKISDTEIKILEINKNYKAFNYHSAYDYIFYDNKLRAKYANYTFYDDSIESDW